MLTYRRFSVEKVQFMPTKKRTITFYAEPEVQSWYESLESGEGSRQINRLVMEHLKTAGRNPLEVILKRLEKIELRLDKIEKSKRT